MSAKQNDGSSLNRGVSRHRSYCWELGPYFHEGRLTRFWGPFTLPDLLK